MTPEEKKWRESACSPAKARKMLKVLYVMLAIWIALSATWLAVFLFSDDTGDRWTILDLGTSACFAAGLVNTCLGIRNNKRVIRQAQEETEQDKS